jgi:hydroxypyruvate isomerase
VLRFSANLNFLFADRPMAERFAAAAANGFDSVEMMFPHELGLERVEALLAGSGLSLRLFNMGAGDWASGERGLACLEGRDGEFAGAVDKAVMYAGRLGTPRVNCLAGIPKGDRARATDILHERVAYAADAFARHGLTLLLENINEKDVPGFLLSRTGTILSLMDRLGRDNIRLQYDIYHAQRMEGELTPTLLGNLDRIGHIQVADNPGRHQPGTGEVNFPFLFGKLAEAGYDGWIGLEYTPLGEAASSLAWMRDWR